MRLKTWCALLSILIGMNLSFAHAQEVVPTSDLGVALQRLAQLKGFTANFEQTLTYAEGGERVYTGDLAVLRPGKFRWQYVQPYVQLYVGDGRDIWLYEPDLMQVQYLQDLGEVSPVVMQLLDGRIGLLDVQVLQHMQLGDDVSQWQVSLGQDRQRVNITLGVEEQVLRWIESQDAMGNRNRLLLLKMKYALPQADLFVLDVPKGVDVVGDKR